jgi:hypothetical protein
VEDATNAVLDDLDLRHQVVVVVDCIHRWFPSVITFSKSWE